MHASRGVSWADQLSKRGLYSMTKNVAHLLDKGRSARGVAALCAAVGLVALIAATPASAQDPAPAAKAPAAAPAAKAPAAAPAAKAAAGAPADKKSAWVKLCEKAPFNTKDKDGKDVKNEKNICLTHHERLDGNTGMVMVSAAILEIEGNDK